MTTLTPSQFGDLARRLAVAVQRHGFIAPGFRCPPRIPADRTIRRRPDGSAVVAVTIRNRSLDAVLGDLVEGVLVVNGLRGREADGWRLALVSELRQRSVAPAA